MRVKLVDEQAGAAVEPQSEKVDRSSHEITGKLAAFAEAAAGQAAGGSQSATHARKGDEKLVGAGGRASNCNGNDNFGVCFSRGFHVGSSATYKLTTTDDGVRQ